MAIAAKFAHDRPISVLTAGPHLFGNSARDMEIVTLPSMIAAAVPTPRLFAEFVGVTPQRSLTKWPRHNK